VPTKNGKGERSAGEIYTLYPGKRAWGVGEGGKASRHRKGGDDLTGHAKNGELGCLIRKGEEKQSGIRVGFKSEGRGDRGWKREEGKAKYNRVHERWF